MFPSKKCLEHTNIASTALIIGIVDPLVKVIHPSDKALFSFQSTLEVVLTPITERYLGFTPMQNAYVYGITGGVSSLGYISLLGIVFLLIITIRIT